MDSAGNEKPSKRKPNWTDEDSQRLVLLVVEKSEVLFSKFSSNITSDNKKTIWESITKQINSASVTCGTRDIEEVKRRWKDIKLRVKKKEAARKQQVRKTGGGPPPDVTFKPWENEVLSLIPEESISGLKGGVDTDLGLQESCAVPPELSTSRCQVENATTCNIEKITDDPSEEPFIVYEVEIPTDTDVGSSSAVLANDNEKSKGKEGSVKKSKGKNVSRRKRYTEEEDQMERLIEVKRERIAVEKRKATALERIATALEMKMNK